MQQNKRKKQHASQKAFTPSYNAPHMIVVSTLNQEVIEQALRHIQSQGALLACTKPL